MSPGTDNPFDRDALRDAARTLADHGVYLGTSSWKYEGWVGQIYTRDRYLHHGRFAATRFERLCLAEYAEVFPTVCVDAAYYQYPSERQLAGLAAQVPESFRFTFKVTDEITVKRFPRLPRFGDRAGESNPHFLDAERFTAAFLGPLAGLGARVGVLIFEFSRFYPSDFARGRDFVAALDGFLCALPRGWRYGVEIRNRGFLHPDYFAMLARHGVAHVFNSWEAMPALGEQLALPGAFSSPEFSAARLLLRPGRPYAEAVERFSPYDRLQEPYPEGRGAGAALVKGVAAREPNFPRSVYVYVNNRFEGSALRTLEAMLAEAGWLPPPASGR